MLKYGQLPSNYLQKQVLKSEQNLPSECVLRKIKHEAIRKDKNSDLDFTIKCPLQRLMKLKYTQSFQESIYDIGLDKFFVHYWLKEQMHLYNQYCKEKSREKSTLMSTLIIDATGGLVKKIARPFENQSGNIFLYQGISKLNPEKRAIPIIQMLSESHDTIAIANWLEKWIRNGELIPKMTITDHILALMGGISRAFNHISLEHYMELCFNILHKSNDSALNCFIRVDYAHIVKIICSFESLRKKPKRFREFYIRGSVLAVKCSSLPELESIVESLLVVSNSEFVGKDINGDAI